LLVQRPTPNLENQASVFMTPKDRVAQLYPQALGTHFSRLLRHERVTVGLLFYPGHHAGALIELLTVYCYKILSGDYRVNVNPDDGDRDSLRNVGF
jgi:hypothetical protein